MCLIVFAWRPDHSQPLVVAANRDEFHARPSLPLGCWEDAPWIIGGRDLQAGGTWMGVTARGRFAALTNIRAPGQPIGARSRGELPERYLRGELPPADYLAELAERRGDYAGYNLLVGDRQTLWHLNSHDGEPKELQPGVYGLSNAGLDTPWPKLRRARAALTAILQQPEPERLLALLADAEPADYLAELAERRGDYAGYNLLVGDRQTLWHLNSHDGEPKELQPGVYGLSNAGLDTPWPKLRRARAALTAILQQPEPERLLALLADAEPAAEHELPQTGVPLEWERRLSSIFIASPEYGTRASTALIRHADGSLDIIERSFGPAGPSGEVRYRHPSAS